jgi:hypothetical protein
MSIFTSKLNTLTGKMEWELMDEDYDYQAELARAGFADMLHDYERVYALFLTKISQRKSTDLNLIYFNLKIEK